MDSFLASAPARTEPPPLLQWTAAGLYCAAGGFHIDPHRPVPLALITHAHSDHARRGSKKYITADSGAALVRARLGKSIVLESYPYREPFYLNDVKVSFHPAGHILGSSQIRVERAGEVWVASGDYKREADPSCEPFETVTCDHFITEATFGTPKYQWDKTASHGKSIDQWWTKNSNEGFLSIIEAYSLGKTQRLLAELKPYATKPIYIHSAAALLTDCYRLAGISLAETRVLPSLTSEPRLFETQNWRGQLIIAPPSWLRTLENAEESLGPYRTAFASGWVEREASLEMPGPLMNSGFRVSDHADWNDLIRTIQESQARRVFVLHRSEGALVRHLRKLGIDAHPAEKLETRAYSRLPPFNLSLFK
jgi:putative mRNA 3-end processing factor